MTDFAYFEMFLDDYYFNFPNTDLENPRSV